MSDEPQAESDDEPVDADASEQEAETEPEAEAEVEEPEAEVEEPEAEVEEPEADAEEAEPEAEADEADEGLESGAFVSLDYTVRTQEDGTVVDTTIEDVAEEAGIAEEDYDFSPRTVVLGAGHVFQSVDEELTGKQVGDTGTVEIPAAEAFGEFDQDQVRTVSADKIDEDDRYPGARVTIDGQQGHVETIIGGRARVDFNHPLAGEDLEYEWEIVDVVDDPEEQAKGMLQMYLQQAPEVRIETATVEEEVTVEMHETEDGETERETELQEVEKETLYIEATPQMTMNQQWMFSKQQIAQDIIDRLDLDRVVVEEVIEKSAGGLGGMMGGMGGMGGAGLEEALEDVDVDADEIVDELEAEETEE